ncbi:hypothetical protein B5F77_00105 [Parabacteroides sp. An277]|nr:hypothetical protein B5F77_00105 [Parabacteroides sp. An277]
MWIFIHFFYGEYSFFSWLSELEVPKEACGRSRLWTSCQRCGEFGADCRRVANVAGKSEQIMDESSTLQGSRRRLWTSCQRCREVGADCGRAANVVGSSAQIVDESPTLWGVRRRLWTGGCKFLFMLPYLQIILIFAIESN